MRVVQLAGKGGYDATGKVVATTGAVALLAFAQGLTDGSRNGHRLLWNRAEERRVGPQVDIPRAIGNKDGTRSFLAEECYGSRDVCTSAQTKRFLVIHNQQVYKTITLVAIAHRPSLVGVFLLVDKVIDSIDNGDAAALLGSLEHRA